MGLGGAVDSSGLEAAPERLEDVGDADDLFRTDLALHRLAVNHAGDGAVLDENHCHGLSHVLGSHVPHPARALSVQAHKYRRLTAALIEPGRGVGNLIAGDDDAPQQ